ncbi:MAG: hypothetical protein ACP5MZ_00855 [Candidatus Micrarchaeia archaeon]
MNETETPKRATIGLLTAKYVHDLSDYETKIKRLAEEMEKIKKRIASNEESKQKETIEYGSGIAGNFTGDNKPLALYIMVSFFKDDKGHDMAPERIKAGMAIKTNRILKGIDSSLSAHFKKFWMNESKLETDLKDTLAYLEANGFVKSNIDLSSNKFDSSMEVQLTGNGVLVARALKEYIAAKKALERKQ